MLGSTSKCVSSLTTSREQTLCTTNRQVSTLSSSSHPCSIPKIPIRMQPCAIADNNFKGTASSSHILKISADCCLLACGCITALERHKMGHIRHAVRAQLGAERITRLESDRSGIFNSLKISISHNLMTTCSTTLICSSK